MKHHNPNQSAILSVSNQMVKILLENSHQFFFLVINDGN